MLHRRAKTIQIQRENEIKKLKNPSIIDQYLFPNLPDHYSLRKKIQITKNNTSLGFFYDLSQDFCTLLMCSLYITSTYSYKYEVLVNIQWMEMILTLYIFFDLLLGWYLIGTFSYFFEFNAIVDTLSVAPFFFDIICRYFIKRNFGYSFIQGVRTLRLVRVIRMFKTLRFFHSTRRAELKLFLTLACLVFIIAGLFQYLESNLQQRDYDCQYIGRYTNWKPSCSNTMPAEDMIDCDCVTHECMSYYDYGDQQGEPSLIRCETHSFFTCVYYMVITSAGVGYGDYSPTTTASKGLIIFSILFSVIMIPPQINDLLTIISLKSNYKRPYKPTRNENHIILCGNVNSKPKLEQFFKEFFHPDRMFSAGPEYHVVILCPNEPSEAVKDLFISSMLDSRVTYVVGSALSVEDLKKVRADVASGMFFICNTEGSMEASRIEDATTVMRMLSVSNFNPDVECYVQVIRPEDRTILKDSDVEFILCLDEFKTTLIARNSICPGFSTFIENIFHTFGAISEEEEIRLAPWYSEYLHGARMEMYYVPLDQDFLRAIHFDFDKLCEAVYIEYGIVVLALCNSNQDSITFNPSRKDLGKHRSFKAFFQEFNVALIIADDNSQAENIAKGLSDPTIVASILQKIEVAEDEFPVRYFSSSSLSNKNTSDGDNPGDGSHKRGLKRNRVITPSKSIDPRNNVLPSQNSLFTAALQTRNLPNNIPKKILKHPADDFDSDESDPEKNYIGFRRHNDKIKEKDHKDEFQRSSIVYTKSHDPTILNDSTSTHNAADVGVKIVLNTPSSARRTIRSNSILHKIHIPLVKSSSPSILSSSSHEGNGNTRSVRKSMILPVLKKNVINTTFQQQSIAEDDYDSDDSEEKESSKNQNINLDNIKENEEEKSCEENNEENPLPPPSTLSSIKSKLFKSSHALVHPSNPATNTSTSTGSKMNKDELLLHAASLWMMPSKSLTASHEQDNESPSIRNTAATPAPSTPPPPIPEKLMVSIPAVDQTNSQEQQNPILSNQESGILSPLATPSSHTTSLRSSFLSELKNSPTVADLKSPDSNSNSSPSKPRPRRLSPLKIQPTIAESKISLKSQPVVSQGSEEMKKKKKERTNKTVTDTSNDNDVKATPPISGPNIELVSSHAMRTKKREKKVNLKKVIYKVVEEDAPLPDKPVVDYHDPSTPQRNSLNEGHGEEFKDQRPSLSPKMRNESRKTPLVETSQSPSNISTDPTPNLPTTNPTPTPPTVHTSADVPPPGRKLQISLPKEPSSNKLKPSSSLVFRKSQKASLFSRALNSFKKPLIQRLSGLRGASDASDSDKNLEENEELFQSQPETIDKLTPGNYGLESMEVMDLFHINNHIIVFGNTTNLPMFIPELRRPSVRGDTYHPLVIISPNEPEKWDAIKERYNDVYFLRGSLTRTITFNRANIDEAFAVILFCNRDEKDKEVQGVNEYNSDSDTLFTYLKLEQYVPRNVFFSVELTCSENMAVLNSTIMRRVGRTGDDDQIGTIVTDKQSHHYASVDKDSTQSDSDTAVTPLALTKRATRMTVVKAQQTNGGDLIDDNISRRASLSGNHEGRFTTKRLSTARAQSISSPTRKPSSPNYASFRGNSTLGADNLRRQITTMHRRISTIEYEPELEHTKENTSSYDMNKEETFWDATDTHHMLPVFASARAYVPSSFMSLLVQSFFGVLTPLICEKLVCGQTGQSVVQIALPPKLSGRRFLDLYRLFCFHHVICFGLYRSPQKHLNALLPYIYITPPPDTLLFPHDRVFLYGKTSRIARAIASCSKLKC